MNNHQRVGATSNSHVGRDFELAAKIYFEKSGIKLTPSFPESVGFKRKKLHNFDLGSSDPRVLVECKSYTWTASWGSPSAKIRSLNEAMLLFSVAPPEYRKILFLLKHVHLRRGLSLGQHYVNTNGHLIGPGIEIWELDLATEEAVCILPASS